MPEQDNKNGQKSVMSPLAVWVIAAGAGASGLSGFGSMGQLNQLQTTMEEQVRQAEVRGQLLAEIRANRQLIDINAQRLDQMMPQKGILRMHDAQQSLIDKLLQWTENAATKSELQLAINKIKAIQE